MSALFSDCRLLSCLPDISKWDTSKVTSLTLIFNGCSSLISLPDKSKWNLSNVTYACSMFNECISLSYLPENWNKEKVKSKKTNFDECLNLPLKYIELFEL